jgi:L-alanine-DL-glutamate epimerase-like enolase superfamily enzyme
MGGVTEMLKAMDFTEKAKVRLEPHSPLYGPALVATLHILSAMNEPACCEFYFADLEANPIGEAALPRDGSFRAPQGPGLGIVVDEEILDRYRVE